MRLLARSAAAGLIIFGTFSGCGGSPGSPPHTAPPPVVTPSDTATKPVEPKTEFPKLPVTSPVMPTPGPTTSVPEIPPKIITVIPPPAGPPPTGPPMISTVVPPVVPVKPPVTAPKVFRPTRLNPLTQTLKPSLDRTSDWKTASRAPIEVFRDDAHHEVLIRSKLAFYNFDFLNLDRNFASDMAKIIEFYWNGENSPFTVMIQNQPYTVRFALKGEIFPLDDYPSDDMADDAILIKVAQGDTEDGDRSYVNGDVMTFYMSDDLYRSTTPAHEFGHALGLDHCEDNRVGKGQPRMMCPRGTLVDQQFQWDINKPAGKSTVMPHLRLVTQEDIDLLELPKRLSKAKYAVLIRIAKPRKPNRSRTH